jgi:hypothetical protein
MGYLFRLPAEISDASGPPAVADGHSARLDHHRHPALAASGGDHLVQLGRIGFDVMVFDRVSLSLIGLTGPIGVGSTGLAVNNNLFGHDKTLL